MKWIVFTGFLVLLGRIEGSVLRCSPNGNDAPCLSEKEKVPQIEGLENPELECLAGSEWESNCHFCRCSDSGTAVCHQSPSCDDAFSVTSQAEQSRPVGKECAIGSAWKTRCQSCVCSETGYPACNLTACDGEAEHRCAPLSVWLDECNSCWCSPYGIATCTKIGCERFGLDPEKDTDSNIEEALPAETQNVQGKKDSKHIPEHIDSIDQEPDESSHNLVTKQPEELTLYQTSHNMLKRSACKPNQQFQNECNTCQCAADGQTYTCTQAECLERDMTKEVEVFMESEGVDHIERHSVCKPADTFYIGCNTCHCNYDGTDFSCTNKPCPLPDDVELFHELRQPILKAAAKSNQTCKAKAMFIKDCNICWCNDDGTDFFCTRKVCVPDQPEELEEPVHAPEEFRIIRRECRPYEVFELDCNMCRCNPDGKSFSCTRRACLELEDKVVGGFEDAKVTLSRKVRHSPQDLPKACQPGQEFRLDCNKCLCDNEGLAFSCTRIDCAAQNSAQSSANARAKREVTSDLVEVATQCTPEAEFQAECNTCRCSKDGKSAQCTRAQCAPNNLDSTLHEPEPDPGFRCNPGEQFKKDCNDCTCSADGRSTFCTLRFCDDSLPHSLLP